MLYIRSKLRSPRCESRGTEHKRSTLSKAPRNNGNWIIIKYKILLLAVTTKINGQVSRWWFRMFFPSRPTTELLPLVSSGTRLRFPLDHHSSTKFTSQWWYRLYPCYSSCLESLCAGQTMLIHPLSGNYAVVADESMGVLRTEYSRRETGMDTFALCGKKGKQRERWEWIK